MYRVRFIYKTVHKNAQNNFIKYKSTKVVSAAHGKEAALDERTKQTKRDGVKTVAQDDKQLGARLPLVKSFFLGEVDKELLAFPEVITRDEMTTLQNNILPMTNYFSSEESHNITTTLTSNVQQLGLFGINAPKKYEGKGWNWSASLMATEPESKCTEVGLALLSHRVIIDILNEIGTEEQKELLLHNLTNGTLVGTEAIFEYNVPEIEFFNTTAVHNVTNKTWTLNGEKDYVVSGPIPQGARQLYLVIAQTQRLNVKGDAARGTTIFLVDSATPGITLGDVQSTIGYKALQVRKVHFDNVNLNETSVVGYPYEGNQIADILVRAQRLRISMLALGMAKNVVNEMSDYCLNKKQCGVNLTDVEIVRTHLSKSLCITYALESMIYLTAGLMDEFKGQDVAIESAITKYYGLTNLFKMTTKWMDMMGPKSLLAGEPTEISFRNAAHLYTQGESVDTLKIFIAVTGLQHAGVLMQDEVSKSRNPLFHPGFMLSRIFNEGNIDEPKIKLNLGDNLHPSMETSAKFIELSVGRLKLCVELLLKRYGVTIVECHNELQRITEVATLLYAMFASVSRASRSYCIGLSLSDRELLLATAICSYGHDRIKFLTNDMFNGEYLNNDNNLKRLAKQIIKQKSYFPAHPLNYNF